MLACVKCICLPYVSTENPRLPQKSASVQRTSSRRALGDLTNRAPKSVQKPKDDVTCAKKKPARIETEDLDEIEIGPPPENNGKAYMY